MFHFYFFKVKKSYHFFLIVSYITTYCLMACLWNSRCLNIIRTKKCGKITNTAYCRFEVYCALNILSTGPPLA